MSTTDVGHDTDTAPTLVACPGCGNPFAWPPTGRCERCGADLAGSTAAAIFDIDREADALRQRRQTRVQELLAAAARQRAQDMPPPVAPTRPTTGGSRLRPQLLLAAAGAVLLLAAVIVFIAVTWPTWPASAQVAFVAVLTVASAFAARAAAHRELLATADALGVLTLAIAAYSLLAARAEGLAGLDAIDATLWVALVATAAAVAARPFTAWAGLRDTPLRLGVVAAVVAGGSGLLWLDATVATTPAHLAVLAGAPTVAALLLLHGRWCLRPDDGAHHVVPVLPALLLVSAAAAPAGLAPTPQSTGAVAAAAVVGLPLLVWTRQVLPRSPWTAGGAVIAVLWSAAIVTFVAADATAGALDLAMPRLVTFSVVAAIAAIAARQWTPPRHWRDPALVAGGLAIIPAAQWTIATWIGASAVILEVFQQPFTGWPGFDALTTADLLLAAAALGGGAVVLERLRPTVVIPFLVAAASAAVTVATVSATAAGRLPMATPLLVAGGLAAIAAWWWQRDATQWVPVVLTHVAAVVLATVDLELFAATTAVVAGHLVWVAGRRRQPSTAAAGAVTALVAVAATTQALAWSTPVTTLLVTLVAAGLLVWAQLTDAGQPWRHVATDVVVVLAVLAATAVAQDAGASTTVAVQLAIVAVAAVVHAARPGRGWAVWLASVAASGAIWTLLGDRGVDIVEAYTMPAALALAAAGAWRLHSTDTSSWAALWPACAMASLPTLVVLFEGPDTVRVLLLATGAVAVALAGHWRRLAALLAAGTVVAMVAAVLQLHYWTMHLPRWVTFGALGLALLFASATYETQLRRARDVQQHLRRLR